MPQHQVPEGHGGRDVLADNRGDSGAHHTPVGDEDEDRIQYDIDARAHHQRHHGKPRRAVRPDDRIQALPEDIARHAQGQPEQVLSGKAKRLFVDIAAERLNQRLRKNQIEYKDDGRAYQQKQNGSTGAPVRSLLVPVAQADAAVGSTSVADHRRNGQSNDGQRKDHRVGRIAVGAQITRIRDNDLIHNVIERPPPAGR